MQIRKFFTLALLLTMQGVLFAQSHVVWEYYYTKPESTIIREYIYPKTITCVNTENGSAVFILSQQNMQTIERSIDGYYINDMVVDVASDSVFFCGKSLDRSNVAIVGFFNISSLFYGSGDIYIEDNFYAYNENTVSDLKRLVSYISSGKRHIVCVGNTSNPNLSCVVDVILGSANSYTVGVSSDSHETITDIEQLWHQNSIKEKKKFNVYTDRNSFKKVPYNEKEIPIIIKCGEE